MQRLPPCRSSGLTRLPFIQGRSKSAKDVLKRIDYGGSATLLLMVRVTTVVTKHEHRLTPAFQVLSFLVFLSMRFSEEYPVRSPMLSSSPPP